MIVGGDREAIVAKLQTMQPILLDVLPMSLEEIFTYEMETLGYTFQIEGMSEEGTSNAKN